MHFARFLVLLTLLFCIVQVRAEEITVSAATSLKEAFSEVARDYEKQYPDAKIKLNTAASGVLLQQILQGSPADVLATADEATMDKAVKQQAVEAKSRQTFAVNTLVLIKPKNHIFALKSPQDLTQASIKHIAMGKPASVPAGAYTQAALEQQHLFAQLQPKMVYTQNVRQTLDYVRRGEVEAGFVYRTDALLQQDKVHIVATVPTVTPISYPLAVIKDSTQKAEANRFVQYILSKQGQAILQKYGFGQPK